MARDRRPPPRGKAQGPTDALEDVDFGARTGPSDAQKVIGGRFILGEATILQAENSANEQSSRPNLADEYRKSFIKSDVPFSWHSNNTEVGDES